MFFIVRTAARGARGSGSRQGGSSWFALWALCFALAVPVCAVGALFHAIDHHAPPAPMAQLVTFDNGWYSDYGTPTFEAGAANSNAAAVTVHSVTVVFVNNETGQEIVSVTERVAATVIPGGQSETVSGPAPQAVAGVAAENRRIGVTVTGWS